jgi:tRNA (uracil-5-)-methyltransferase TRM9
VKQPVVEQLLELNHQFYQTFALEFSATRQRLQPGVQRILQRLEPEARLLDLGCGNGELVRELNHRGQRGFYAGLDSSPELIRLARQRSASETRADFSALFIQADLAVSNWETVLLQALQVVPQIPCQETPPPFEAVLAFAVLHHLPSKTLRRQVLSKVNALLAPEGRFNHSVWQFLNSPRLQARILPWETLGLTAHDVDLGDYLLDWRRGGHGLRYIHHFTLKELEILAAETGFQHEETFYSDGEGGKLGLYQVWRRA